MKCSSRRNCNELEANGDPASPRCLNEVQFPKELQPGHRLPPHAELTRLNEVQFPKELQLEEKSRYSDNIFLRLNEVQFPKELQPGQRSSPATGRPASMKCSSRRNCNFAVGVAPTGRVTTPQ